MAFARKLVAPVSKLHRQVADFSPIRQFASSFDVAVKKFGPQIATHSNNTVKLDFYALYKQATAGDCDKRMCAYHACVGHVTHTVLTPRVSARPGMLDMVGRAKHDAWKKNEGMSPC
jgi:acyl-CoA-binding protein